MIALNHCFNYWSKALLKHEVMSILRMYWDYRFAKIGKLQGKVFRAEVY
ncbi:hypothetical protein RG47T_4761 [Mucilaginibacter polytrichastri]|uniref:Uncharacterized protein n=1 Tax=Mucilaginibacter polytrichastri TaxID=1302689 RepID=A0A1Q6A5J9_9SPHI|nr:hypothetical protein RG47T_4761 [Mucilaginibacter polytrichastri]